MTVGNEIAYYFRPVNGSDSNDGKSFGGAWKTWQKVIDEMCVTGGSGVTTDSAILFLVNEGGSYTGPYHSGKGESSSVDYYFTAYAGNQNFEICGLSADGSYDANTNFEFDLSGFTGQNWLRAAFYSGPSDRGIVFRNITWKNATTSTDNIITQSYDDDISNSVFINCTFQDNEVNYALVGNGAFNGVLQYKNCKFIRNNTYDTAHSMLSTYATVSGGRGNASTFVNCLFEENQTSLTSSNYLYGAAAALVDFTNCLFYNNGHDTDSVCIYGYGDTENSYFNINNCIFFNNTGTSVYVPNVRNLDTIYGYSNFRYKIYENIFVLNNKSIDMVNEPGLRFSYIGNNVFYNNTVEDIPDIMETLPGISGGNHVFDPEFTNGYSGDFSVPHDSRLFSYSTVPGVPIGGSFVQKKSLLTIPNVGSLSIGGGDVGDTYYVSGRRYQKVNSSPPVWRRVAQGQSFVAEQYTTLLIHDEFNGTGNISGRTPDTVDNGNTWTVPESAVSINIGSGYAYRSSKGSGSSPDIYYDSAVIDLGTSAPFRIRSLQKAVSSQGTGIVLWNTDGTGSNSETHLACRLYSGNLNLREVISGVEQTALSEQVVSVSAGTNYLFDVLYDGTTVTLTLYDSTGVTQIGQVSSSSFAVTPNTKVGIHFGGNSSSQNIYDFKVYV